MNQFSPARPLLTLLALGSLTLLGEAQIEHGGEPPSAARGLRAETPTVPMPRVSLSALRAQDRGRPKGEAYRFGEVLPLNLGIDDAGVWESLPNGDAVWRLRLVSPGALSITVAFDRFQLPEGAELYAYDDEREFVRGAYTWNNNKLSGQFAIQPTPGEALTLEYYHPSWQTERPQLHLATLVHDYRGVLDVVQRSGGLGSSGSCNVDVACPQGAGWSDQMDAMVQIVTGTGVCCSGSLVNNSHGDGTAIVISAEHCGDISNAVFTFNFRRAACGSGGAPTTDSVVGAIPLVTDVDRDVRVARLSVNPPASYGAKLNGWDRSDVPPASVVGLHHPSGDAMKISIDDDPPSIVGVEWNLARWELGVTEGGSSGSPLFDPAGRFIGHLSRGASICGTPVNDFYIRLGAMWDLLEPYLDPTGSGVQSLPGLDPNTLPTPTFVLTGIVEDVETLMPGTRKEVNVLGAGFTDQTTLEVDGVPLPATSYVRAGNGYFVVDLPELTAGVHTLTARDGLLRQDQPFTVVAPPTPVLQVGDGNPDFPVSSIDGVNLVLAGPPGEVHACVWSLSNVPSVEPRISLDLGNNFTDIAGCSFHVIPPAGFVADHKPAASPGGFLIPVYVQSFSLSQGVPAPVSNLQSPIFTF